MEDTPVPGSFPGLWSQILSQEEPGGPSPGWGCSVLAGSTPVLTRGTPEQGYTSLPGLDSGTPQPELGYPLLGLGYPLAGTGILPPPARTGVPLWPGLVYLPARVTPPPHPARTGVPPRHNSRVSTCYVAGCMPLAVTQEDFPVFYECNLNCPRRISYTCHLWTRMFQKNAQISFWIHYHGQNHGISVLETILALLCDSLPKK